MNYPNIAEADNPLLAQANPGVQVPGAFQPTSQPLADPRPSEPKHYGGSSWCAPEEYDFTVPSGALCRVRKVRVEDALTMGVLEDIDLFTAKLMQDADGTKRKPTPEEVNAQVLEKLSDGKRSGKFFTNLNKMLVTAVIAPKLSMTDDGNLPEGVVFVDNIDFMDKMAIFREVFQKRMEKIEPFREGQAPGVGSVDPSVGLQGPS